MPPCYPMSPSNTVNDITVPYLTFSFIKEFVISMIVLNELLLLVEITRGRVGNVKVNESVNIVIRAVIRWEMVFVNWKVVIAPEGALRVVDSKTCYYYVRRRDSVISLS